MIIYGEFMSKENEKTLSVYQQYADKYMENTIAKDKESFKDAQAKERELHQFLKEGFLPLQINSTIFEIGAGAGENSLFLANSGYNIIASDVAGAFLNELKNKKLNTIKFDVLKDDFKQKYAGILCWRVFVHFTKEDAKIVLYKVFNALVEKGRFIFNAMNCQEHSVDSEWLDFHGYYHLGVERYYQYYDETELKHMIEEIGFKIVSVIHRGGTNNNKWLIFILEK